MAGGTTARGPGRIGTFLDLIKFAHTVFALPFALIATVWALKTIGATPSNPATWVRLGLILACMVLARTFAMTVNRLVDRKYDALNPRTARRPSVSGLISPGFMVAVIALCAALFALAAGAFWWAFANLWPLLLCAPVLAWLGLYSFTKRFTALCHLWLGASLGLAPVSAWIAIVPPHGPLVSPAVALLGVAVLFWVGGFDILYALQDEEIDRAAGLHSIPAAVGRDNALWLSRTCHLLTAAALVAAGIAGGMHACYWAGTVLAVILLVIEQALVRADDISRINVAFMTVNGIVGVAFGTLGIADLLLR